MTWYYLSNYYNTNENKDLIGFKNESLEKAQILSKREDDKKIIK